MKIRNILGHSKQAQCALCGVSGPKSLFDVDHKIPRACQGPNVPWNLWPLCLNHHRMKSIMEYQWLPKQEKRCFSCNRIVSRYFYVDHWCTACQKLSMPVRIQNLENNIRSEINKCYAV